MPMKRMLNVIGSSMIADCEQQEAGIGPIYVTSKKYKIIFSHLSKLHVMNTVAAIPQCHFDINDCMAKQWCATDLMQFLSQR